jgi:hypothetical protein
MMLNRVVDMLELHARKGMCEILTRVKLAASSAASSGKLAACSRQPVQLLKIIKIDSNHKILP